jgi:hypothetical protein
VCWCMVVGLSLELAYPNRGRRVRFLFVVCNFELARSFLPSPRSAAALLLRLMIVEQLNIVARCIHSDTGRIPRTISQRSPMPSQMTQTFMERDAPDRSPQERRCQRRTDLQNAKQT